MNINVVTECTALSLAGKITFGEVVEKLATAGVERYIVDLVGFHKFTYGVSGNHLIDKFSFNGGGRVAKHFNGAEVKNAILDIQQGRIDYQTFLRRIMMAGCSHYEVFIAGKKAIYFGCDGSHHIENFPKHKE
ncbi:MAG TPA: DUF1398 family protein [Alphaproteobacteria bacterium]|nr:DUF1398 family protein [Alphaproteobacteria bacterium]